MTKKWDNNYDKKVGQKSIASPKINRRISRDLQMQI